MSDLAPTAGALRGFVPQERKMRHVAVLMGGWSAERAVSLVSGSPPRSP